ncbi:MAG TPA: heavy metal translocating P-type ATPase [Polyangium sp.]|nr:heavy metal translocating P-type ATPase [Polyangium sp.]
MLSAIVGSSVLAVLAHRFLKSAGLGEIETDMPVSPSLTEQLSNVGAELREGTKNVLGRGRTLVEQHTARFFRSPRQEYLDALRQENAGSEAPIAEEKSVAEAEVDRHLGVSAAGTAIAIPGAVMYAPLGLLSIPFTLYSCIPLVRVVYTGIVEKKKLRGPIVDLVALGASMGAHYYALTAASCMLMCLAEKLVYRAQDRSRKDMISVFRRQRSAVWMVDGDEIREVTLAQIHIGDIVVVVAGGTIPVDGVIISGSASIDQHMLTGESTPVERHVNDPVLGATVVLAGNIRIRVEKTGDETIAAQIAVVMDQIAHYRERQEMRCDETADKLVWPTLGAGALTYVALGLQSTVTVIGCNFTEALRIAYPLGALSYLNLAAKEGILVKDARALEMLGKVDTLLFDKTGTLTLAQPHVAQLHPAFGIDENTLLTYAASAELRQTHPIARAIQTAAEERKCSLLTMQDAAYDIGFGIRVVASSPRADDVLIRVGSARYMNREGIVVPENFQSLDARCHAHGHSLVHVAVGDTFVGAIELHATLRPEVRPLVEQLKLRGIQLHLVSGDHELPTKHLAEALEFDGFVAQVLPADKARFVERLQRKGHKVGFIGDGINDAIALEQADVSISLRGATTVATDVAQVILMDQDLTKIVRLLELAKELDSNLERSLGAMVIPSAVNLAGALFFHLGIRSSIILFNVSLLAGAFNGLSPFISANFGNRDESTPKNTTEKGLYPQSRETS